MTLEAFKKRWPGAAASGFDTALHGNGSFTNWSGDDYIRVAAYWKKKPIKRTLVLMPDGSIDDITDQIKDAPKEQVAASLAFLTAQGARVEERDSYKVCRYLMTLSEILEESDWPGMYIPIIPVLGEEVRIGRDIYRHGIVRYARDLQRMVNYYSSAETEVIALQPKAPWIGTKTMFQDHYDLWETANTENHPFLEYTADPKAPGPPQRVAPPVASQAIQEGALNAANDMKAVIGIYDAGLGAKSNETSGVAIQRRQQEGDTGTFVYIDNFALAIQRAGQIINDLIPHIYDTQRQMRILGEDGKPDVVDINKPQIIDGIEKIQHDVTTGSYDVMIEQGPSYSTKRQEAKDGMTAFIQAFPPAAPVIGDLYAKAQDWPNSEEIGERLQELLPPPTKAKLEADKKQREQASGQQQPPSPEEQQQEAAQQQQQQLAQQAQEMQMAEAEAKVAKAKAEAAKADADARKAKADADKAETEAQIAKADLANTHMDNLRTIERHGNEMDRGEQQHKQDTAHKQDRHVADLVVLGISANQGNEKHEAAMKNMTAKPEQATAE
jgi:hypothetical protein